MKTQVFAYKGIIGIKSDIKAEGLLNDVSQPSQLGFVLDASKVEMSKEALKLLKTIKKNGDCIGDVDVHPYPKGVIFNWLGGSLKIIDPKQSEGSRDYNPGLLDGVVTIVPNKPPKDFKKVIDDGLKARAAE